MQTMAATVTVSKLQVPIMRFKTEEEIEEWFNEEKQKLEKEFLDRINKDKTKIPQHREKFDAGLRRLLAKYEAEHHKLLESQKSRLKHVKK